MKKISITSILLISLLLLFARYGVAEPKSPDEMSVLEFLDIPLQDMLKLKVTVPGALTKLSRVEAPASITVISADDIRHTPARNIYDLIEVYVPGAIWMNYEEGPVLGVRGSVSERAYKYLLRVNGRVVNNKGHYGTKSELELWDLSDISRIEVVRGPGSVVYGLGAVAGVINIITHDAKSAEGLMVSSRYISEYKSVGATVSHGYQGENHTLFTFASITRTKGTDEPHFLGSNNNMAGFIGEDIKIDTEPLDYFGDYDDDPQIKLHIDTTFLDHWRFWARYTQQGSHWSGNETKSDFNGRLLNQQGSRDRQWTTTLDYNKQIQEDLSISVMLSTDSSDVERRKHDVRNPDPDHILNKKANFSETEVLLRGLLNWQPEGWVEVALGAEFSRDRFEAGWGDDDKNLRLGDDGIMVSGPTSNAISEGNNGSADKDRPPIFVGDGWYSSTYSIFSEINLVLKPWLTTLFSARVDERTFSDMLFSPRMALIVGLEEGHHIKLIAQKAQRMNTAG